MASVQVFAIPNTLYRYRSLTSPKTFEREIETLDKSYIFCGVYSNLNDPMEGFFNLASKAQVLVEQAIKGISDTIGVGSFCEAHDNELMWAHYADQFRGICIAYDFRRLISELPDDVYFARMHYAERFPVIGESRREPDILAMRVLSYKNYRWAYEREWRMFGPKGPIAYKTRKSIRCVYLGPRINDENRRALEARLGAMSIPVKAMTLDGYSIKS
jgi:DUF2971 family protein